MMNILVLGGTRFFGIHAVNSLLSKGYQVTIATRGKTGDRFGDRVERVMIERSSPESLAKAFGHRYFDVVCDNLAYCSNDVKYLLDSINCGRYVMTSSAAVYTDQHLDTIESEFNPLSYPLIWCSRQDYPYAEVKRQAECALFQSYPRFPSVTIRFPYVIGEDDYTKRLSFYVEQTIKGIPMHVDNLNEQISFISSKEAGDFLAWTATGQFTGPINGNNRGTVSMQEVMDYVEQKTAKKAVLRPNGLKGPYNDQTSFSLDTTHAKNLGYDFPVLSGWIHQLLDKYINNVIA
jgi:nucleoside-diphosphate-sugar epimerase